MKLLSADDLRNLNYGEKVYRKYKDEFRGFRFVGFMPSCKNYLIFEDGEELIHLHISENTDHFNYEWYGGEYDSKFIGDLKIQWYLHKIETTKKLYGCND